MGKQEYMQANKEWLAAKAAEESVKALPKGIYYESIDQRQERRKASYPAKHRDCPLYRTHHQRKEI